MSAPSHYCPRCGCCSLVNERNGSMTCVGDCDEFGIHPPSTVEEFKEVLAERDAEIARLRRELAAKR